MKYLHSKNMYKSKKFDEEGKLKSLKKLNTCNKKSLTELLQDEGEN